jgi:hypothetical protein
MKRRVQGDAVSNQREEKKLNARSSVETASAGKQLWDLLISEYASKQLSAKNVCAIACAATDAGAVGVAELAILPDQEHHASRHLNLVLAKYYPDPKYYYTQTPVHEKIDSVRKQVWIPMRLPSLIFDDEFQNDERPPETDEPEKSKVSMA